MRKGKDMLALLLGLKKMKGKSDSSDYDDSDYDDSDYDDGSDLEELEVAAQDILEAIESGEVCDLCEALCNFIDLKKE